MTKQEKQLRLFAQWLKDADDGIDFERDGQMETAIKKAVQDCMFKIGDWLEEIIDMEDEQLNKEY
tara:strand:- start:2588 stop:2782 length:195 start_codon:yes stop_codon:yes gene_type:complete